ASTAAPAEPRPNRGYRARPGFSRDLLSAPFATISRGLFLENFQRIDPHPISGGFSMKNFAVFCAAAALALFAAPAAHSQAPTQTRIPGTQVHVRLVDGLSTRVSRSGDPFTAVVTEPVFSGNTILIPAGAKVHGTLNTVERPRWMSMFRGGASMNLV